MRRHLLRNKKVLFAGYRIHHPLIAEIKFKVAYLSLGVAYTHVQIAPLNKKPKEYSLHFFGVRLGGREVRTTADSSPPAAMNKALNDSMKECRKLKKVVPPRYSHYALVWVPLSTQTTPV
eukprot:379682-Amorphochlora_amoeboformis.AAC.1